jgi:hypothetical protein
MNKPIPAYIILRRVRFLRQRVEETWEAVKQFGVFEEPISAEGYRRWRAYEAAQHALCMALMRYGDHYPAVYIQVRIKDDLHTERHPDHQI